VAAPAGPVLLPSPPLPRMQRHQRAGAARKGTYRVRAGGARPPERLLRLQRPAARQDARHLDRLRQVAPQRVRGAHLRGRQRRVARGPAPPLSAAAPPLSAAGGAQLPGWLPGRARPTALPMARLAQACSSICRSVHAAGACRPFRAPSLRQRSPRSPARSPAQLKSCTHTRTTAGRHAGSGCRPRPCGGAPAPAPARSSGAAAARGTRGLLRGAGGRACMHDSVQGYSRYARVRQCVSFHVSVLWSSG